jgi:hypothetical protein
VIKRHQPQQSKGTIWLACDLGNRGKYGLNTAMQRAGIDRAGVKIVSPHDDIRPGPKDVLMPLGEYALRAFGVGFGIDYHRGYVSRNEWDGHYIMPSYDPGWVVQGNWNYEAVLVHDLQRAEEITRKGYYPRWGKYLLDPTPADALRWVESQLADPHAYVSYDIETPDKGEREDKVEADASYKIIRVSFSMRPYTGMSVWWGGPYMAAIKAALENQHEKIGWNSKLFDDPRLRHNGVSLDGELHDGMTAWHVLHSDLDKGLGFVATFMCPEQPRWKHLGKVKGKEAFYNAVDSDVALRNTLRTFEELRRAG